MATRIDSLFYELELRSADFTGGLTNAQASAARFTTFMQANPMAVAGAFGAALLAVGIKATQMAAEVDTSVRAIAGSLPQVADRFDEVKDAVREMSVEYGASQIEVAKLMKVAAEGGAESVDAMLAMTNASLLAARAVGDLGRTEPLLKALDSTLDVFKLTGADSERVLAKLFVTAQGKGTIEDLTQGFGKLSKQLQDNNISFELASAATATLIGWGRSARAAMTELGETLERDGAAGLQALADKSTIASDGLNELHQAAQRNLQSAGAMNDLIKAKLNATLVDIGTNALPLLLGVLNEVNRAMDYWTGAIDRVRLASATTSVESLAGALATANRTINDASKSAEQHAAAARAQTGALAGLTGALSTLVTKGYSADTSLGQLTNTIARNLALSRKSPEDLKAYRDALNAIASSGQVSGRELEGVALALAKVNAEIRARGGLPIVAPVAPATIKSVDALTAAQVRAVKSSKDLTEAQKKAILTSGTLSDTMKDQLAKAIQEGGERALEAARKSHDALEQLQELANRSQLELLSANQKAYEEVEQTFRQKMQGMSKEDHAKAEAFLKKTHDNQLLAWLGFDAKLADSAGKRILNYTKPVIAGGVAVTDFNEILKKHGKQLTETEQQTIAAALAWKDFKEAAAGVAFTIADAANGMLQFIDAIGMSDEKVTALVGGIRDLAEGIGMIASGNIAGGILKGVEGLAGAINGLFGGESESARRVRVELERTQEELERHRRVLGDLIEVSTPGAKTENIVGGVQKILDVWAEKQARGGVASVLLGVDPATVGKELAKLGLTIADLEDLAKQLGIDLHPGGSKFFNTAQLNALLADLGARDSGFAETFEGQRDRLRDRQRISDAGTPEKLSGLVDLSTGGFGSPALAAALEGAEFTSEGGRGSVIGKLLSLFDRGDLTGADLGGLNLKQLREVISELADLIRQIGPIGEPTTVPVGKERPPIPDAGLALPPLDAAISLPPANQKDRDLQETIATEQANINAAYLKIASAQRDLADKTASNDLAAFTTLADSSNAIAVSQGLLAAAMAELGQVDPNVPTGTLADPITVDPLTDPAWSPDLEARSWQELLRLQTGALDQLARLAELLGQPVIAPVGVQPFIPALSPSAGVQPPALPPVASEAEQLRAVLAEAGAKTTQATFTGDFNMIVPPGTDAPQLLQQFVEVLKSPIGQALVTDALNEGLNLQLNRDIATSGYARR